MRGRDGGFSLDQCLRPPRSLLVKLTSNFSQKSATGFLLQQEVVLMKTFVSEVCGLSSH